MSGRSARSCFPADERESSACQEQEDRELRNPHPEPPEHCAEREHDQESQNASDGVRESPDHAADALTVQRLVSTERRMSERDEDASGSADRDLQFRS
jgi:hypothetical protein